jgi:hypothetical protein
MSQRSEADDLGPMPEPRATEAEPSPGGRDALPAERDAISADLDPDSHATASHDLPESLRDTEDTSTAATSGAEVEPDRESPA